MLMAWAYCYICLIVLGPSENIKHEGVYYRWSFFKDASEDALTTIRNCWLEEIAHGKTILNPEIELSSNCVP